MKKDSFFEIMFDCYELLGESQEAFILRGHNAHEIGLTKMGLIDYGADNELHHKF